VTGAPLIEYTFEEDITVMTNRTSHVTGIKIGRSEGSSPSRRRANNASCPWVAVSV
jgi:hypothetical protein